MIVLDATIVDVALPSIQEDLGFSQSDLAWVVNAYLIPFGGLLLLAGRARRPARPAARVPDRPRASSPRPPCCAHGSEPGRADRRPLPPGHRRSARLGRDPGNDRHDVPRAQGAGEGDRRLHVRRGRGRFDRPARRRRADRRRSTGTGSSSSNLPIGAATALLRAAPGRGSRGPRPGRGSRPGRRGDGHRPA